MAGRVEAVLTPPEVCSAAATIDLKGNCLPACNRRRLHDDNDGDYR
jgi:hypothetical protein